MAQTFNQVGPAVPAIALGFIRLVRIVVNGQHIPHCQRPFYTHDPGDFGRDVGLVDRLYFIHQEVVQCLHVLLGHIDV